MLLFLFWQKTLTKKYKSPIIVGFALTAPMLQ
ncbi:hypothetical protein E9Q_08039 [Moraxella catarrhalis BC1]|nr:hypothetical protein E9G_07029 [Moraxella catarrhalis 7169]EGE16511.1 hypothetical protein E9Q_08039 [Moraxella catarrhalis BC1]